MIGKNISRYRILGQVGEGGMGVVYVAEDTVLGRRVAVKIPHAGRDESHYRARFLREARAVSKLRHENIAAVHDYGETEDGQPFIVMELVSGQTLGELLSGAGISIARSVEVARQTAEALSEAHRLGVVHRDVKPSNVVIDDAGTVKVLDFGLAKQLHEESSDGAGPEAQTLLTARTRSDVVIGTPLYLSPEQARGAKVDGRSDLFALGALLYECLTGRPAFSGANVIEIGAQVLHFDPPPPSRFNPRVPAELDRLTLKALAKKPEDRFQTAAEMAAELARMGARLPASDVTRTRRLAGADNGHRSSALITMAQELRRPKISPLALAGVLAAIALAGMFAYWLSRPSIHEPAGPALALYERGLEAMREGSYYRASGFFAEAVEKDQEFVLAHARLAEALTETDFIDRAKDEMLFVIRRAPDFSAFPREEALYLEAVRSTVMQDQAGAISAYEQAVKLNPKLPQAHLNLGRAYERDNQTEKAVQSYTEAIRLDGAYAAAFLRLGALHTRLRNRAGAVAALERAQKLYAGAGNKEGEAAVHYQQGRLFANLFQPAEAHAEFTRAMALAKETDNKYQQVQTLQQLANVQSDQAEALKTALSAVEMAQASGMNDQLANSRVTLGNVFLRQNKLEEAESNYNQALQLARNYKVQRFQALATLQMGSVRVQQRLAEDAERLGLQARDFYLQGGYRSEADQCLLLIGRARRMKGDHAGALKVFEELLAIAERTGDLGQLMNANHESGSVLLSQDRYPEALKHFQESAHAASVLHYQTFITYSNINQANAFWALGRYDAAAKLFGELTGSDPKALGVSKNLLAVIHLHGADMALSRQRFAEAAAGVKRALAILKETGTQTNDLLSWANGTLCVAESSGGSPARGRELCEEAARLAELGGDPGASARAQFALALALLESGDAPGARDAALRAQEVFTRLGRADSEWRALAVAGKASRLAGDQNAARDYTLRAAQALSQLEQSLGADADSYRQRPDVQWLRGELGGSVASAVR